MAVTPPSPLAGCGWRIGIDSADDTRAGLAIEALEVAGRSVTVLVEAPAPKPASQDPALVDHLASAAGIAPEWWSLDGVCRTITPDTKRALLAAMGLPADGPGEARDSLSRLSAARDRRRLPFALTQMAGETGSLRIAIGGGARPLWLAIENEDGEVRRLRADAATPRQATALDGGAVTVADLALPSLAAGRYRLTLDDRPEACALTVAPRVCWRPPVLAEGGRLLGLSAQLYSLSRSGDQGVGDFTTLSILARAAAGEGLQTVAINPLHAVFSGNPERASPYQPSDRRFLNPLYLDLDRIEGAGHGPVPPPEPAVDYTAAWALKTLALEHAFAARPQDDPAFDAFVARGGDALAGFAAFQAISEARPGEAWTQWPEGLRDAGHTDVRAFAAAHAGRVRFHQWLQWLCDRQLADAADSAGDMALGLYRDLAVGAAPDGAEAWEQAKNLAWGVSVGAPPDAFSADGQVWGLPPPNPHRWIETGFQPFASLLRANMRHAGALRLDHVMALSRLFWVPGGADGAEGAYVAYPFADLVGQLTLESHRARCLVVGEDMGVVPHGFREAMAAAGILGHRALPFERDGTRYRPPRAWPHEVASCISNHDLAPLAGWWAETDLDEALGIGRMTPSDGEAARTARAGDRAALVEALTEAGLVEGADPQGPLDDALAAAIHAYVAATPSAITLVQADDLSGETVSINLPGTDGERPNWRRRVGVPVPDLLRTDRAQAILSAMHKAQDP